MQSPLAPPPMPGSAMPYFCKNFRPFVEKYRSEFQNELGDSLYKKLILCFEVIPCCIVPVQSAAFTLGLEDTLAQIYFSKREKQREDLMKLMGKVSLVFTKRVCDACSGLYLLTQKLHL